MKPMSEGQIADFAIALRLRKRAAEQRRAPPANNFAGFIMVSDWTISEGCLPSGGYTARSSAGYGDCLDLQNRSCPVEWCSSCPSTAYPGLAGGNFSVPLQAS
jgi:hypothetical protein